MEKDRESPRSIAHRTMPLAGDIENVDVDIRIGLQCDRVECATQGAAVKAADEYRHVGQGVHWADEIQASLSQGFLFH